MQLTKLLVNLLKQSHSKRQLYTRANMACSRYEYVKSYEQDDGVLQNVWIVIRVDGKGFHKFAKLHDFDKPNDIKALNLMNTAAIAVMEEFRDIIISYGQSDEYSFVFRKDTKVFNRRASKLLSYVTSLFTSAYVMNWPNLLTHTKLQYPPCFDGRIILYPSNENLRDYLSWRQADVHVNNLYNTAFWNLVLQAHLTNKEAEAELRGTFAADKNEILFSRFNINYNSEPAIYRKGTILLRKRVLLADGINARQLIVPLHEDMIRDKFWKTHTELLGKYIPGEYKLDDDASKHNGALLLAKQIEKLTIKSAKDEESAKAEVKAEVKIKSSLTENS